MQATMGNYYTCLYAVAAPAVKAGQRKLLSSAQRSGALFCSLRVGLASAGKHAQNSKTCSLSSHKENAEDVWTRAAEAALAAADADRAKGKKNKGRSHNTEAPQHCCVRQLCTTACCLASTKPSAKQHTRAFGVPMLAHTLTVKTPDPALRDMAQPTL